MAYNWEAKTCKIHKNGAKNAAFAGYFQMKGTTLLLLMVLPISFLFMFLKICIVWGTYVVAILGRVECWSLGVSVMRSNFSLKAFEGTRISLGMLFFI